MGVKLYDKVVSPLFSMRDKGTPQAIEHGVYPMLQTSIPSVTYAAQ